MKPPLEVEEWVVSIRDVKQLYISMRRRLVKWAVSAAILSFFSFGLVATKYEAVASFKEGIEKTNSESILKELLGNISQTYQPQASSFMKSYQVLRPLVATTGMQISPIDRRWFFSKIITRLQESLKAENRLKLEDPDSFLFQNVSYSQEEPFHFTLRFTDPTHFAVYSKGKNEIGKGVIGAEVHLPDFAFTLAIPPKKLKIGASYPFRIRDWISTADTFQKELKIKNDKDNKSIVHISYRHRNRCLAAQVVNELMSQYQSYLKREYDHVAKEQLAYLEGKQNQIFHQIQNLFDEHTAYLSENLEKHGFIGIGEDLLAPYQEMAHKLASIDLELSHLDQNVSSEDSQKIQELKQERDLLELSLCQVTEHALEERREELKSVRNQRYAVERLIQEVDRSGEITAFDLDQGLVLWAKAIQGPEEREDFAEYLENYTRLLSLREKMLQERFFYGNSAPAELEGIDLSSARSLFIDYNFKLDAAEAAMRHYEQLKKEIPRPNFDLASLSTVLKDPVCQKVIEQASELGMQLKDQKHHSTKEGERWEEEIALHRTILLDHLDQLKQVEALNAALIREKMAGLQKVGLDCINRQISVLHEQTNDAIKQRRQALLIEKALYEQKMEKMRSEMALVLPEKWRFEKLLGIQTDLATKVIETLTEAVESKTIASHTHHVESKPLDLAFIPPLPQAPKLFQTALLSALLAPFFLFSFSLIRQITRGFPTSLEKLKALRLPVLGSISPFCDGPSVETPTGPDLDLLRRLALFAEGAQVIGLIEGAGPDYSYALGENLARMSIKSIILRCDFLSKFRKEDTPGLLQLWNGEIAGLPIQTAKGFDYVTAGGYCPFGTEIIQSQNFTDLIEHLKKNYDWVFLLFRAPLSSAESAAALRLCEKAIVTVSGEQTEELTPFVNWAYHENGCRLTFITKA